MEERPEIAPSSASKREVADLACWPRPEQGGGRRPRGWTQTLGWGAPGRGVLGLQPTKALVCFASKYIPTLPSRSSQMGTGSSLAAGRQQTMPMQGEKGFNSQTSLRIPLWGEGAACPPAKTRCFSGRTLQNLSGISGAEEQQENPVSHPEPRHWEHKQACRAATLPQRTIRGRPWQPRCLGCRDEPGLVGMPCPTACSGTTASLAAPTARAFTPTLVP